MAPSSSDLSGASSGLHCPATLLLARHGDAEYVEDFFSDEGGSLTRAGRQQSTALAQAVARRRIAHVWCSDTSRAVQTAEIAAARLDVGVTAAKSLREIFLGELLGTPFDAGVIDAVGRRWTDGDLAAGFPGGESGEDVVRRYGEQLAAIADSHRGETVLVVVHQTAISVALPQLATGLSPADAAAHQLGNGEHLEVVWEDPPRVIGWPPAR